MMQRSNVPAGDYVPTADQRIVMYNQTWSHFEDYLRLKGDAPVPRLAYLNGVLELMTPSRDHERLKSIIGLLIEAYALEDDIDFSPYGGWLLKSLPSQAGIEPDECYIIGKDQDKNVPNLAIEVVWTHGGLDKLEIYRRLGVREVWVWRKGQLEIYVLENGCFGRAPRSVHLPLLDVELLSSFLDRPVASQAIRAFRQALRDAPRRLTPRRRKPAKRS